MKNPYGLKDGRPVLADEVARGLACGCTCPCCGHRLEAHKGDVKAPYFAHDDGADCSSAYQTALHLLAKEVLCEHKRLVLPSLHIYPSEELGPEVLRRKVSKEIVAAGKTVVANEILLERKIGDVIPDVLFHVADRILLVEIWVTHRVDSEKRQKIETYGLPTIEFDFSRMNRVVTKDDLYSVLVLGRNLVGYGGGHWIFHPKQRKAQEAVDQEFLAKKGRLEDDLRRWQKKQHERWMQEQQQLEQERKRKEAEALNQRMVEYSRKAEEERVEKSKREEEQRKREFLF